MHPYQHPPNSGPTQQGQTSPGPPPPPIQRFAGGLYYFMHQQFWPTYCIFNSYRSFLDISLDTWCINRFREFQTCSGCLEKVTPEVKLGRKCVKFSSQTLLLVTSFASIFASSCLQQLPVITSNTIVRCRSCRTYINPFVTFLDQRRWKCNLCYRINDGKSPGYN